ncbi:MAG: bifunctional adenosylcobinamide kinase/adenosylcobinamide-phosphate guanylyltransferase [Magnetococcales bacterium]|nr:bifunctional adenosylcobinamide kinase/adenosylcobinamide-phosphate guanylyltransferase [Magnetococcales bacterium]
MAVELILGGARSGKTSFAQHRADALGQEVVYVATARAGDPEMNERIRLHQQSRPAHWRLVEEPVHLARVIAAHAAPGRVLLVDCLTLWLTHLLTDPDDPQAMEREKKAFLHLLPQIPGEILLVNNETGLGIIPMGSLTRRFVDENGWLNQSLARFCRRVTMIVAGLPLELKKD